jgi:peptidoglycan/xylan/chitin deacetylase (PgdA/CDA1 family)
VSEGPLLVALKVDVDTYVGTRDGVPRLLEVLGTHGVRATFYFSLGPDNSGRAIFRVFTRKGFLRKMLRTRAPSVYGLRTVLSGTLLPAPKIGARLGHVLGRTARLGHEVGIHAWDHVTWHDRLPRMSGERVRDHLRRAAAAFQAAVGRPARTSAAPGWTVSASSLEAQDELGLSHCSDCRGSEPFYPLLGGRRFRALQIPTTLPTMDELLGEDGIRADTINDHYLGRLRPGLNVHTIHAELEGGALAPVFQDLLARLRVRGARFLTLAEVAEVAGDAAGPAGILERGSLPGRAGPVAVQVPGDRG